MKKAIIAGFTVLLTAGLSPANAQSSGRHSQNGQRYPQCIGYDLRTWKNPRICWNSCLAKGGDVSVCYCECMYGADKRLRR